MLQIRELEYAVAGRPLLQGIDLTVGPGDRVALIGPNGGGKTTLFRLIIGELVPRAGQVNMPKKFQLGYLPQEEIHGVKGTVLEMAVAGKPRVRELEDKLGRLRNACEEKASRHPGLLKQLGELEHEYEAVGGYRLESEAKTILSGLGFSTEDFHRPLSDMSGGWRMRADLARLLVQAPDLLLLDEPTNHLDLPAIEWLEQYLGRFQGGIVLISHDRYFIDRLVREIYELDQGSLRHYHGDYHAFEEQKEKLDLMLRKKYELLKSERERQERFIERFRYKASKATQVQSRVKQLEKMEDVRIVEPPPRLSFQLTVGTSSYKDVLTLTDLSFRYDENWIFQHVDLNLSRGDRVALVGANGTGKTTLTRLIARQLQPQSGSLNLGKRTAVGYYAQHQVDSLNLDATIYEEISSSVADHQIPRIRDVLGTFQFSGDDVFKRIQVLSGGEKARVSLAKILLSPVNFLVMDEPTNHLDIVSIEALEHALQGYTGTLLLISHDRYFLDKLADRVIEMKGGLLTEYWGNYSYYLEKREEVPGAPLPVEQVPDSNGGIEGRKTREQKRREAEIRQEYSRKRSRLKAELVQAEEHIENLEKRKVELESFLARPETYQDGRNAAALQKEYAVVRKDLERTYVAWETANRELDEILAMIEKQYRD